jgi:hypothetical protein
MASRESLQALLEEILGESAKAYFQPPANVTMTYPCVVYRRDNMDSRFADNVPYVRTRRYQMTVIDRNPDSEIIDKIAVLPMCFYNRSFTKDGLNHDVFVLYY